MIEAELADGTILEFPDGTPPEVVQQAVKRHLSNAGAPAAATPQAGAAPGSEGASDAAQPYPRAGGYGPFMAGVADSAIRGYLGIKQFAGGLDPQEQAILREQEEEAKNDPNSGWRTGGRIAGDMAALAVPGAKLSKALPMSTLGKVGGGLASTGAVSGLSEFAISPGDGETFGDQMISKAKNAGTAAVVGPLAHAGGSILKKALTKPFAPSAEAARLMSEKVYPTLQQGAEGRTGRLIGGLTSGAVNVGDRQNREVMEAFLRRINPNLDTRGMTVTEIVGLLRPYLDAEKAAVVGGKKFKITPGDRQAMESAIANTKGMRQDARELAGKKYDGVFPQTNGALRMGNAKLEEYQRVIRDRAATLPPGEVGDQARTLLGKAQDIVTSARNRELTLDEQRALDSILSRSGNFERFEQAATNTNFHANPRAKDLLDSYAKMDPQGFSQGTNDVQRELLEPAVRTMGLVPRQEESRALMTATKRIAKGAAGGAAIAAAPVMAVPYGVSLAGQTKAGSRALFGDYESQKKLAELMRAMYPYMGAQSGAALNGE